MRHIAALFLLTFAACADDVGPDEEFVEPDAGTEMSPDGAIASLDGASTGDAGAAAASDAGVAVDAAVPNPGVVAAGVRWIGRVDLTSREAPRFSWSGTGFVARFRGTGLRARLSNSSPFRFKAVVDGMPRPTFVAGTGEHALATGLTQGEHTIALHRQSEGILGESQLTGLVVDDGALLAPPAPPARLIELIGDSISAGYGNLGKLGDGDCFATQSHWDTYGAMAARAVSAELSTIAASGHGAYRNYDGDTMGTIGRRYENARANSEQPKWTFDAQPQVVVINIGTNDVGKSASDPGQPYRDAYLRLVRTVRAKYPGARIVATIGPMLGGTQLAAIRGHLTAVVGTLNGEGDAKVSTFFGFETQTTDKFGCDAHPNLVENQLMGDQLAAELRRLLGW
ncbi:MAG: GDSL-type esterase/lipase family protein [Polyangiales bacterium]